MMTRLRIAVRLTFSSRSVPAGDSGWPEMTRVFLIDACEPSFAVHCPLSSVDSRRDHQGGMENWRRTAWMPEDCLAT
jgi:hypothetical protein